MKLNLILDVPYAKELKTHCVTGLRMNRICRFGPFPFIKKIRISRDRHVIARPNKLFGYSVDQSEPAGRRSAHGNSVKKVVVMGGIYNYSWVKDIGFSVNSHLFLLVT